MSNLEPRRIETIINPDGSVKTEFIGFIGKACMLEEEKLRAALAKYGIKIKSSEFEAKPELALDAQDQTQTQQNRHQI